MDDIDLHVIHEAATATSPSQIRSLLQAESKRQELTISTLNLLYNLVSVQSLPTTLAQRQFFDQRGEIVRLLLARNRSLEQKKHLLLEHPEIVRTVALACPDT